MKEASCQVFMWSSVWIIRAKGLTALFILCLFLSCTSYAASGQSPISVPVKYVSFDDITCVSTPEELEDLLYPSGMELPTKYLDLYMFAESQLESVIISPTTYDFLKSNYPVDDGAYTWAEYYAAQLYVSWVETLYEGARDGSTSEDVEALEEFISANGIDLIACRVQTRLVSVEPLLQYLSKFKEALLDYSSNNYIELKTYDMESGVSFTLGYDYLWQCTDYSEPVGLDLQDRVKWYNTRIDYMNTLGIVFDAASGVEFYSSPVETGNTNPDYVNSLEAVYTSRDLMSGHQGVKDYVLIISLVVVVASLLVLGISDFIRRRRDPLSHWRRYL